MRSSSGGTPERPQRGRGGGLWWPKANCGVGSATTSIGRLIGCSEIIFALFPLNCCVIIRHCKLSSSSSISSDGAIERIGTRKGVKQFLAMHPTPNQRAVSAVCAIWQHGSERQRLDDNSMDRYWRCRIYKGRTVLKVKGTGGWQTSYASEPSLRSGTAYRTVSSRLTSV